MRIFDKLKHPLGGLLGHALGSLRSGFDVTVMASLIANFPHIDLQSFQ
jgi:hypothetical protein